MEIRLDNLSFAYGDKNIFKDVSLVLDKPELVCVLGPNGVGKSTLMYCMNKLLKPTGGKVYIDGKDLNSISLKEMAKVISFVPHAEDATFSMTVMDTVLLGRMPHSGMTMTERDVRIAAENIKLLGMEEYQMHGFDELSAGQHQRVMIARGLTQEPQALFLDEPTANLDVRYQMLVMRLLRDIAKLKNITVVAICHDLNVTSMYADRILMLYDHRIFADGSAHEVMTRENIKRIYNIDCVISDMQGRPHISLMDDDSLDSHLAENLTYADVRAAEDPERRPHDASASPFQWKRRGLRCVPACSASGNRASDTTGENNRSSSHDLGTVPNWLNV